MYVATVANQKAKKQAKKSHATKREANCVNTNFGKVFGKLLLVKSIEFLTQEHRIPVNRIKPEIPQHS
jgi:hypothetical protein